MALGITMCLMGTGHLLLEFRSGLNELGWVGTPEKVTRTGSLRSDISHGSCSLSAHT